MTVQTTFNKQEYTGNGSTTTFDFSFPFFVKDDIIVTQIDTSGIETKLVIGTNYSIPGVPFQWWNNGSSIVLTSPLPNQYKLIVERIVSPTQETSLRNLGRYDASAIEKEFDKLTMICQQITGNYGDFLSKNKAGTKWLTENLPFDSITSETSVTGQSGAFTTLAVGGYTSLSSASISSASIGTLTSNLNAGGSRILNLPPANDPKEPMRKGDAISQGAGPTFQYVDDTYKTNAASQIGYVYSGEWSQGIVIPDNSMTDKRAYWYNGQLYTVGTDTGFTSNDFNSDLASGKFSDGKVLSIHNKFKLTASGSERSIAERFSDYTNLLDHTAMVSGEDYTMAFHSALSEGKPVFVPAGTYKANIVISNHFDIFGAGENNTKIEPFDINEPAIKNMFQEPVWKYPTVSDLSIGNSGNSIGGVGFSFGDKDTYNSGDELIGRVKFSNVFFYNLDKSIQKCWGNIGNVFDNVSARGGNYFYWARGSQVTNPSNPVMHAGADTFNGGQVTGMQKMCCLVLDKTGGLGQWTFNQTVFQFNPGGVWFWDVEGTSLTAFQAVAINNVWNEGNATNPSVTIDSVDGGTRTVTPTNKFAQTNYGPDYYELGKKWKHGTTSDLGSVNIWGNERVALNLEGGGIGSGDYVDLAFSNKTNPNAAGAFIRSKLGSGQSYVRDIEFNTGGVYGLKLLSNKLFTIGDPYTNPEPTTHSVIYGDTTVSTGDTMLEIVGTAGNASVKFNTVTGTNSTQALKAAVELPKQGSTNRSLNAPGTVNASGADYAEYMLKRDDCGKINAGDVCGIDKDGLLTDIYDLSVTFAIKSTNPSFVGNDILCNLQAPEYPVREGMVSDSDYNNEIVKYYAKFAEYEKLRDEMRERIDRVAFCGQVPVNAEFSPGDYLMPVRKSNGGIGVVTTKTPTFEQFITKVGKALTDKIVLVSI